MISTYAQSGRFDLAFECLRFMQEEGIRPDDVTFVSILSSCSHMGLAAEFFEHLRSMKDNHGIKPDAKHYTCMIDLLGHAGMLDEAGNVHRIMHADVVSWISLLTACKRNGNFDLARVCFNHIVRIEPENAIAYALMSAMYSDAGMERDAAAVEAMSPEQLIKTMKNT
jgi:pentatricopeptide repeat protein